MNDGRDHTAPWHCSAFVCDRCAGKPSWSDWWKLKRAQADERARQDTVRRQLKRRRL